MKRLAFLFIPFFLFAYQVDIKKWGHQTFFGFLRHYHIPISLYYKLDKKTQKKLAFIASYKEIYLLKNGNTIKQALIPLDNKKQLQIIKENNKYITKIVPIIYDTEEKAADIKIKNFLSYDVYQSTKNPYLTHKIVEIFKDRINFNFLPANTELKLYYKVKSRFGKIDKVDIIFAEIKNRYYDIDAYKFSDGRYYDSNGRSLRGMFLSAPLVYKRISSPFGMRFHPILHIMRMHDGIDYVNKVGTPIKAVADGKIIYRGWIRGYGNCIEIRHKYGYMTLYGHMKGFNRHIRNGQYVAQGTVIGYLGNTGLSTGPHLHFGVMHNGKWINPIRIKKSAKIKLYGRKRRKFLAYVKEIDKKLNSRVAMK